MGLQPLKNCFGIFSQTEKRRIMKLKSFYSQTCAVLMLFFLQAPVLNSIAQSSNEEELQNALAKSYVASKQTKDTAKLIALLHPKVRACMNEANRPFFDGILTQYLKTFPSGKILKITITPVASNNIPFLQALFPPAEMFPYPVKPTHDIAVNVELPSNSADSDKGFTAMLEIAEDHGNWYWVTACPTDKGVEYFKRLQQDTTRQ